jgi:hypothetical protein
VDRWVQGWKGWVGERDRWMGGWRGVCGFMKLMK